MVGVTSLVEMDSVNLNTFEVWALKRSLKLNTRWTDIFSIRVMRQKQISGPNISHSHSGRYLEHFHRTRSFVAA